MDNQQKTQFRDMEILAIMQYLGVSQHIPDLLIYDSTGHSSRLIRKKPFRSRHFSIVMVTSGTLSLKVNLFEYQMHENEIIVIPPSAIREMDWKKDKTQFTSLLFTPEFLTESGIGGKYFTIADYLRQGHIPQRKLLQEDYDLLLDLARITSGIINSEGYKDADSDIIKNLFRALLLKVKQYYNSDPENKNDLSGSVIYRFLKLLSDNYLNHREVLFYADKLNINEKYLTQLLKRNTGKTAREFIIEMVILEAKVLLDENVLSIKEIADRLNFMNQFHFSRFFKQYSGMPPTAYRDAD